MPNITPILLVRYYPAATSHRSLNDEELLRVSISKGLVRVSTGLENIEDIIDEFDRCLRKI